MRPRNLKIEGFTCFREPVEIDFTALDVFVISGPTGAGKTTIIDAICYALYGKVPRETTVSNLISRNANALSVQLEFDAGGRRYRVHRGLNVTRTTNKKTGEEGHARHLAGAFEECVDGDWTPLEDRVARIDHAIEERSGSTTAASRSACCCRRGALRSSSRASRSNVAALLIELLDMASTSA